MNLQTRWWCGVVSMLVAGCAHEAATGPVFSQSSPRREDAAVARARATLERCEAGSYSRSGLMYQCGASFLIIRPDCPVHGLVDEHELMARDLAAALPRAGALDEACAQGLKAHCSRLDTEATTFRVVTAVSHRGPRSLVCGASRDADRSGCDALLADLSGIDTGTFFEPFGSPPRARASVELPDAPKSPQRVLMTLDPVTFVEAWQAQMSTRNTATASR